MQKRASKKKAAPARGRSYVTLDILKRALETSAVARRDEMAKFHSELKESMASKDDLAEFASLLVDEKGELKVATRESVQPIVEFYNNAALAARVTSTMGKWGYRTILTLAGLFIAWGVFLGGFKAMLAGVAAWALGGGK